MEDKKRYKATNVDVSGPFDGWIIEELDEDEYEKEAAKEAEAKKASATNTKLTREELEKKREEQLNKIKELINKKKNESKSNTQAQAKTQIQPQMQEQNNEQTKTSTSTFVNTANLSEEELEKVLIQKSKDTGIPIEVLRMIEEKKKEIRARKKNGEGGNTDHKKTDSPTGTEIADTVEARRKKEDAEAYYEERQVRKLPPKKKAPNGEEIGDRKGLETQADNHDLYNVMDDVGLDSEGLGNEGLDN